MDCFPAEVKELVFKHLDSLTREEVVKVSKTWSEIIFHLERNQHFLNLRGYKVRILELTFSEAFT